MMAYTASHTNTKKEKLRMSDGNYLQTGSKLLDLLKEHSNHNINHNSSLISPLPSPINHSREREEEKKIKKTHTNVRHSFSIFLYFFLMIKYLLLECQGMENKRWREMLCFF